MLLHAIGFSRKKKTPPTILTRYCCILLTAAHCRGRVRQPSLSLPLALGDRRRLRPCSDLALTCIWGHPITSGKLWVQVWTCPRRIERKLCSCVFAYRAGGLNRVLLTGVNAPKTNRGRIEGSGKHLSELCERESVLGHIAGLTGQLTTSDLQRFQNNPMYFNQERPVNEE